MTDCAKLVSGHSPKQLQSNLFSAPALSALGLVDDHCDFTKGETRKILLQLKMGDQSTPREDANSTHTDFGLFLYGDHTFNQLNSHDSESD